MKKFLLHLAAAIALSVALSFEMSAQPLLDNTFSGNGYLLASPGGNDFARSVLIQNNGCILTGGNTIGVIGNSDIHIVRTLANGSRDNTFGTAGIATIAGGFFCDMALLPNGKIIVAGSGVGPTNNNNYIVYRLTKNGILDTTFGNGGSVKVNMPNKNMICFDVVVQTDGKIVLGGYADDGYGGHHNMIIVRLKANGKPDNSFASGGKFTFTQNNKSSECNQLALQPDGKIVAVGHIDTLIFFSFFRYDFGVLRLNTNGTLDNTFGSGGAVRANKADNDIASAVSVLSDGRIVAGGSSNYSGNNRFAALCLLPNGSFDTSFGTDGWSFLDFYGGSAGCTAMAVEPDDDIVMAGLAYIYAGASYQTIALAKLLSNGAPDNTFGANGIDTSFYGTTTEGCSDIALQTDNKIVLAGYSYATSHGSYLIARYTNSATFTKQSESVIAAAFDVSIHPNPCSGEFVMVFSNPLNENTTITIANHLGQMMYIGHFSSPENQINQSVSLSPNLVDGIYFVTIKSGKQVTTKQLVVQR